MSFTNTCILIAIMMISSPRFTSGFTFTPHSRAMKSWSANVSPAFMAPRFDKASQKWFPTKPEEESGAAYGPIGSLIRAGPKPFIQRILFSEQYDQAVLKYMAQDGCSRKEAQGNMDAYIENPNDWTYQKLQEKQGKPKYDYANANTSPKQLVLSGTWATVVFWFFYTFISDCLAGKYARP